MKKKFFLGTIALICVSMVTSCTKLVRKFGPTIEPSSNLVSKSYTFDDIHGISVAFGIIVQYTQQPQTTSIKLTGPQNVVDALEITKEATKTLSLEIPDGDKFNYTSDDERLHVWISAPDINNFQAIDGAVINIPNGLKSDKNISAEAYSGSVVRFNHVYAAKIKLESHIGSEIVATDISTDRLDIEAHNESTITVTGNARASNFTASSASIDAVNLISDQVNISELPGGKIKLIEQNTSIE